MKQKNGFTLIELIIVVAIIVILVAAGMSALGGGAMGFKTDINGYRWFGCGHNDWYHTGFKANAPNGSPVTGVVCKGYWSLGKSNTIRVD